MVTTKPKITQEFENSLKIATNIYRVNINEILIDVFPHVFPPKSPFSESTHTIYDKLGYLEGQNVLDIGTGTGIQAIYAALAGASKIDAVDINDTAVSCAKHNVKINNLEKKINVWKSDIFSNIDKKKYDLIIANLPILDMEESDIKLHSLYDPGFVYHERLFDKAKNYLSNNGKIILCHANLQENGFEKLEDIAKKNNFSANIKERINSLGFEWRNYYFTYNGGSKK